MWTSQRRWFPLLGLVLFLSGCASRTTKKTSSVKRFKNIDVSAAELSYRNQSLLALYSSEIESAADKIILESPSPSARRQALIWKAEAIPTLQRSLLNTDPVAAVVDTWVFNFQMTAHMEQPEMKNQFGLFQPVVVDALKRMDVEMEHLVLTAAPAADIPDLRKKIGEWAAAHPIRTNLSARGSADIDLLKKVNEEDLGALASLKALQEGLGDITARLDSYNAYLPKQARWQAELLVSDLANERDFNVAVHNFTVLAKALDKTSNNFDRMPELATRAHDVALGDVDNQRLAAQSFLSQERTQAIEALSEQRIAVTADLHTERLAATADLQAERKIVFDAIDQERKATVSDLHIFEEQTVNDLDARSRRLVDHLFWRAVEFLLLALLLFLMAAWILLRRFAPGSSPKRQHYDRAA